jgi:hypothetical protein
MNAEHRDHPARKTLKSIRGLGVGLLLLGAIPVFTGCVSMGDEEDDGSADYGTSEHKPMSATHIDK